MHPSQLRPPTRLTHPNERCEHFTIHCGDDCIRTEEQDHPQFDDARHTVTAICLQAQDVGVLSLEQFLLLNQEMPRLEYAQGGGCTFTLEGLPLLALEGTASFSLLDSLPSSLEAGGEWSAEQTKDCPQMARCLAA